ncbi:class I SAM-dependent methyltransferase [Actinomadura madurae]|uniref:class I SAM-dependent methyltransferase n=1 Tax=Actinomadura madurae TaxID=1993 RepID=UPI0020D2372E|nr:class I SAM-dependent methyltransferase [Actinomadura madurae]MCP9952331.1 class I SAM-dependent methyltransferase [Actinomadura madurae]MCP9969100.1 class I SAM-dependent methyltransferase [Actinomadura madurae]MCQ0006920.1 class I SAM-dependent methyltransferase [Actinomadura madurae]MCQ0017771.1 class I SAM-dependent methyltransferase [Actinomadura madurae]
MSWKTASFTAFWYDFAVQNRVLSRVGARVLWNYDIDHLHTSIAAQDPSALTLDIPCGGGIAVTDNPRHVAADLSRTMLTRARRKTTTLLQTDIYALPFRDQTFDACVTYNGLHCLPDPAAAIRELTRVLRPSGVLRGTTIVRGAGRDPLINLLQRQGTFGNPGTVTDLRTWLTTAGLTSLELTHSGAVTGFTARK